MVSNSKQFEERILEIPFCGACLEQISSSGLCTRGCVMDGTKVKYRKSSLILRRVYQRDLYVGEYHQK